MSPTTFAPSILCPPVRVIGAPHDDAVGLGVMREALDTHVDVALPPGFERYAPRSGAPRASAADLPDVRTPTGVAAPVE